MSFLENLRLFLGIDVPDRVSEKLSELAGQLSRELAYRKWTHPSDYHVTLQFLGDTPASRVDAIAAAAEAAAASFAPLPLALGEPGTFGSRQAPHVLWCGAHERGAASAAAAGAAAGALAALHAALGERLAACGFAPEARPLRAHVTLARNGGPGSGEPSAIAAAWRRAVAALAPADAAGAGAGASVGVSDALAWTAGGVTLFRTHLGRRPSYERMLEFPFPPGDGLG